MSVSQISNWSDIWMLNGVWIIIFEESQQWGAMDTETEIPSAENKELKNFPFKTWNRSVSSHACYTYFQEFLPW